MSGRTFLVVDEESWRIACDEAQQGDRVTVAQGAPFHLLDRQPAAGVIVQLPPWYESRKGWTSYYFAPGGRTIPVADDGVLVMPEIAALPEMAAICFPTCRPVEGRIVAWLRAEADRGSCPDPAVLHDAADRIETGQYLDDDPAP